LSSLSSKEKEQIPRAFSAFQAAETGMPGNDKVVVLPTRLKSENLAHNVDITFHA